MPTGKEGETIQLTKLASCAGCGAKVGAGMLSQLLEGLPSLYDERLIVGYDKSDDASVYVINDELALVQTIDFFPPIVDDPFLFGQIAAANALSDVYAMGGEPKLALNVMCVTNKMGRDAVHDILRGGYEKAYEAGTIITGGHTIEDSEPKYGLSVTGFVHPKKVLTNSTAKKGDVLILTKPLGIGILTTAAKAEMVEEPLLDRIYAQMAQLNRIARDIMVQYEVHGCTDVTGFALMGHSCEMARGSELTIHLDTSKLPYHKEAYGLAEMGFVPAGAYRNRDFAQKYVSVKGNVSRAMEDILYDPQTSGGLMMAVSEKDASRLLAQLKDSIPCAEIIGYITKKEDSYIIVN
ncbi:selenide,water dikinase [Anaerotaenia torta]|uniref:selenide, water dikinase SelD n=1 Tax=Anaerotaenia torta TaxID=433293 RepID=UPI003D219BA0